MADRVTNQGNQNQDQNWVNQETDLLMKLQQAREEVQRAEDDAARAQARLDDSRERLNGVQSQLTALGHTPEQVSGMNAQMNAQPGQTGQSAQAGANQGQPGTNTTPGGLPPNETYVDGAVDTERATTPYRARADVLQSESQEIYQTDAEARDMARAEDQGVVSVPPEQSGQQNQG